MDESDNKLNQAGIIGEVQIGRIEHGGNFWTEEYRSVLIKSLESGFTAEVLRTHGISDVVINGDKVLIEWYKRIRPLDASEITMKVPQFEEPLYKQMHTSQDWQKLLPGMIVTDPDGWDRSNYQYSWSIEEISFEEYIMRRMRSTCISNNNPE